MLRISLVEVLISILRIVLWKDFYWSLIMQCKWIGWLNHYIELLKRETIYIIWNEIDLLPLNPIGNPKNLSIFKMSF